MTRLVVVSCVLLLVFAGGVWAEQIGGPSGPSQGEFRLGAEANFRDHVDGLAVAPYPLPPPLFVGEPMRLSTHTFYGVLQYGLTDRLSIRGKAGMGKLGIDATSGGIITNDTFDLGYGLAWSAGLQYRICAPDEPGTSFAISGQFARMQPDDLSLGAGPFGMQFTDPEVEEITAALTVGTTKGKTRPYGGIVWSDFDFDVIQTVQYPDQISYAVPWSFEKDRQWGAVFGLDQTLCDRGWLNLEARCWDEASFSATAGITW